MTTYHDVLKLAGQCGLYVSTWRPGDGYTRYRIMRQNVDYFAGDGIFTGRPRDALIFLRGFQAGREGS